MSAYPRKRRASTAWTPPTEVDYTDVDALMRDLETGQVADLAAVGQRMRAIAETAHQAGVLAGVKASTEQVRKLAEENRNLRIRLVQQSLAESAVAS